MSEVFKPLDDYAWVYGQTKNDLKKLAYEVKASAESKVPLELVVRKKILAVAKNISKEKYTYGTGPRQLVCNTFINKVFEKAGTDSLKTLSAQNLSAAELYEYFSPPKTNAITSANRESFASLNKLPQPGDMMFFVKANGMCGHVGMFSRKDPKTGDIYIYDASTTVGERKLWPGELTPPKGIYKKIYYTSPLKNTTA